jgi:hypothetical protein
MNRQGRVIADRYDVHALKTPTEVRNALNYLMNNARKHGFTTSPLPDAYSSCANQEVIAEPRSWLQRRGFQRAGPLGLQERASASERDSRARPDSKSMVVLGGDHHICACLGETGTPRSR